MIPRYTNPEMGRIWSEQRRYETWLQVEIAAAEAMAAAGIVPAEAARDLRDKGAFNIARIDEIEKTTQHDVIAFTTSVAEMVGPSARWLHFGLTSSDVVDTAQALQMVEACDLIICDMVEEVVHETGDMIAARQAGVAFEPKVMSLNELLSSPSANERLRAARLPMFKSVGAAIQDVVVAELAFEKAVAAGLARPLGAEFLMKQT